MKICKKDDSILNQGPDFWQGTVVKIQIMLDFLVFPFGNQLLFQHVKKVIFAVFFPLK